LFVFYLLVVAPCLYYHFLLAPVDCQSDRSNVKYIL
jgi:hypothetical protein